MSEPTWTTPSDQFVQRVSAFNESPPPFALLSTLFIRYLQQHFSNTNYIRNPGLRSLLWNPDQRSSKMYIGNAMAENTAYASEKPAIYVGREDVKPVDEWIDPAIINVGIGGPVVEPFVYSKFITGAHVIRCESKIPEECEHMTEEVFYSILLFIPALCIDTQFHDMDTTITKAGKTESGMFAGQVAVSWVNNFKFCNPTVTIW